MDMSVKNSGKVAGVVGPLVKNDTTEYLCYASNPSDGSLLSPNNYERYDFPHITSGRTADQERNQCVPILEERNQCVPILEDYFTVDNCEATNYPKPDTEATDKPVQKWDPVSSFKVIRGTVNNPADSVEVNQATVNCGTLTSDTACDGSVTVNEEIDDLSTENEQTEGLITDKIIAEVSSNTLAIDVIPNKILQTKAVVPDIQRKELSQQMYEIGKFFDAINSTNEDMQKKSGILLQKQNLINEILSYIHAVQSIIRLSTSRRVFPSIMPKYQASFTSAMPKDCPHKPFYEAGEKILDELKRYRSELKADFKVWEAYRLDILNNSEQMPYDFEVCEDAMSAKVLMHDISTKICKILRRMEIITSKRENNNENCIDLMDSVDTYIRYSSAFIMGDQTFTLG